MSLANVRLLHLKCRREGMGLGEPEAKFRRDVQTPGTCNMKRVQQLP